MNSCTNSIYRKDRINQNRTKNIDPNFTVNSIAAAAM